MPNPHSGLSAPVMWAWFRVALLVVATSFSNLNIAAAQSQATAGDLMGDARDEQQGVLPGVVVKATHRATGLARSVTTGPDGQFAFRALPVGTYTLEAQLAGFEPHQVSDIVVSLGTATRVTLTLKIAGQQYDVNVVASRHLADPQQAGLGAVVDRSSLDQLPVNARNFLRTPC